MMQLVMAYLFCLLVEYHEGEGKSNECAKLLLSLFLTTILIHAKNHLDTNHSLNLNIAILKSTDIRL